MVDTMDISELEKEMMELFDDYGYNREEKAQIIQLTKNKRNLDDIDDDHYIDMNYIDTSNPQPTKEDYTAVNMVSVPDQDLAGRDFINNILNDKIITEPKKSVINDKPDVFLLDELDAESREKIKKGLADEDSELFNTIEEHSDIVFHLKKLQLIKDKVYKSFFKRRRRSSATSAISETEIELNAEDIEYAMEKESDLIAILLKNIKRYLIENDIKYNSQLFNLNIYEGYKIVDDLKDEIVNSVGIIYINIVPNNKNLGQDCVCSHNKCVATSIKKNMMVTTKDFHKYRYVNTNKLIFKKIKVNDIGYLIEKHKK